MPGTALKAMIDARESVRFPTLLPAMVVHGHDRFDVVIDDLSERGAHIRLASALAIGASLMLLAEELDMSAKVVRATALGYGLRLSGRIMPLHVVRANLWKGRLDIRKQASTGAP